jgi:hypothetical protein
VAAATFVLVARDDEIARWVFPIYVHRHSHRHMRAATTTVPVPDAVPPPGRSPAPGPSPSGCVVARRGQRKPITRFYV